MQTLLERSLVWAAALGFLSSLLLFFIQVGSFADNGLIGMLHPTYLQLFLSTTTAKIHLLRSGSFAFIWILLIGCHALKPRIFGKLWWLNIVLALIMALLHKCLVPQYC